MSPLFHVQDPDRPMYVLAPSWATAVDRWKEVIRRENDGVEGDEPQGVALIADDDDIIVSETGF